MQRRGSARLVVLALCLWAVSPDALGAAQPQGVALKEYLNGPYLEGAKDRYSGSQNPNPQVASKYEIIDDDRNAVVAVHLTHVPGSDKYLVLSRPDCGSIAGAFDLSTRKWTAVESPDSVFCAGHTVTSHGSVIVTGGHSEKSSCIDPKAVKGYMKAGVTADPTNRCNGKTLVVRYKYGMTSIREYDPRKDASKLTLHTPMISPRWYPTSTLLADGRIVVMGGTRLPAKKDRNLDYEVLDPQQPSQTPVQFPVEKSYLDAYPYNYYPFNFALPTGDVFNFCMRISRMLIAQTGQYRKVNGQYVSAPRKPGDSTSQYPLSGTSVMTALRPPYSKVDVIIFGGAPQNNSDCDPNRVAGKKSYRITINWSTPSSAKAPTYSFSSWVEEDMGIPRVMGDSTLLPNGNIVLQNGMQTGCAGDSGKWGSPKAKYPALWAELYETEKLAGQRYTILAASSVARGYHSTAALTTSGTVLVSGCDRAGNMITDRPWYQPPTQRHCERRMELFHPPYALEPTKQPAITAVNGNTDRANIIQLGYDEEFTLTWDSKQGSISVSDVTLVAPSSTTHGFNANQRVVYLPKGATAAGSITLRTPPHPYVAPPQMYMVYALNGEYYGQSWWIQLVDKTGAGKVLPPV